ncbi:MAG: GAF domain-containing protein, partial [Anaerolineales bacterium]
MIRSKLQRMLLTTRQMNETHDVAALVELIIKHVIELTGAGRGLIALYNDERQLIDVAHHGFDFPSSAPLHLQLPPGVLNLVLESQKPLRINNANKAVGSPEDETPNVIPQPITSTLSL